MQIAVPFKYCVFYGFSRKLCSANVTLMLSAYVASGLQRILRGVISLKLHPQEVLAVYGIVSCPVWSWNMQ